jgi:hypothetical protein
MCRSSMGVNASFARTHIHNKAVVSASKSMVTVVGELKRHVINSHIENSGLI